jgi:hypothetical protein
MCRLGGIISRKPIRFEDAVWICNVVSRPHEDAFGYFNGFEVFKAPLTFKGLETCIRTFGLEKRVVPDGCRMFLVHSRNATHGSKMNNDYNHPIVGDRWIVAHNGVIANYKEFTKSELDSAAILELLESGSDIKSSFRRLEKLEGTVSFWAVYKPEMRVFLYTNNSAVMWWRKGDALCFASTAVVSGGNALKDGVVYEVDKDRLRLVKFAKLRVREWEKIWVPARTSRYVYYWDDEAWKLRSIRLEDDELEEKLLDDTLF